MISTLLARFSPMLLLLAIAILIALLLAFVVLVLWRTRKKKGALQEPVSTEEAPVEKSGIILATDTQTYTNDEEATRASVSAAMQLVAENSAGVGGRYRSPWFLVVGAAGSGKSTMLNACRIPQTWHEGTTNFGILQGIQWRFFDRGVVLDIPGDGFLDSHKTSSNEGKWKSLLRNLVRYRPQRPLDGVVLTIPCTELMGDRAISPALLGQRADLIANKLWQIQKCINFSFPVYVVVTKCDKIPGFKNLVACLPPECQDQMFGWSSPYNLETAYSSSWVEEGFDQLGPDIQRLQAEVLVRQHDLEDPDDLFLFAGKFQELRKPLRLYLNQIFKQSVYRESLQFRGFYFCGDIAAVGEENSARELTLEATTSASSLSSPEYVPGEGLQLSTVLESPVERSPVLITDLFREKIFPERGLARPVTTMGWSRNRVVLATQLACILAVIVLTTGVSLRYKAQNRTSDKVRAPLSRIYDNLASRNYDPQPLPDGTDPAYDPITIAENLGGHRFQSIFLPTSFLTPMAEDVELAMVPAFNRLVYTSMGNRLESEFEKLVEPSQVEGPSPSDIDLATLSNHRAFKQLSLFVDDLIRAEDNLDLYFRVDQHGSGNAEDLQILAALLQEQTPPLMKNREALDAIINAAGWPPDQVANKKEQLVNNYRTRILEKFQTLSANLGTEWISDNPILSYMDNVKADLTRLHHSELETYEELNDLKTSLTTAENLLRRPDFAWMAGQEMALPELLKSKLDQVFERPVERNVLCESSDYKQYGKPLSSGEIKKPVCSLLDQTHSQIESTFQKDFENFKAELLSKNTAVAGQLVVLKDGSLQLAPDADKIRDLLEVFLKLPFVMDEGGGEIRASLKPGEQLVWDKDQLQTALEYKKSFDDFWSEEAEASPPNIRRVFEQVALERLDDNLSHLIMRAENFQPLPAFIDPEHSIAPELQNFQETSALLNTLLGYLHELGRDDSYTALFQVTTLQAKHLLSRIGESFDQRALYGSDTDFSRWTGDNKPFQAGFDIRSSNDKDEYLKTQRSELQQYVGYVKPVVDFLDARAAIVGGKAELQSRELSPLLVKWRPIINAKSDAKMPGKSLAALEDFIQNEIDKANPDDCQADFLAKGGPVTGDYFVTTRESLRQALSKQCQTLARDNARRAYRSVASFFNEHLAGRFPFATEHPEQSSSEAEPLDILQFYQLYDDGHSRSIAAGLKAGAFADPDQKMGVDTFLRQIKALQPLFVLPPTAQPETLPAFDFVPIFRVNTAHEVNGNQIIDWTLQVGTDTFRNQDPQRVGRWNYGDPVKLILRWAKDSPAQPVSAEGNAKIISRKGSMGSPLRSVVFEFRDSWALLSMINQHQAQSTDFDRMADPDPQTLVFTINDSNSSSNEHGGEGIPRTKVFIRIKLRPPGKPENLRLAVFPSWAPVPDQGRTQARNTEGEK
jgi:type VI secretion system protein ImpL